MSTMIYTWEEVDPPETVVVRECYKSGIPLPSRIMHCKDCEHFLGFAKITPPSPEIGEFSVACRVPLLRGTLIVQ